MNFLEESSQNSSLQQEELQKSHKLFQNYYQIKDSIRRKQIQKESSHKSIGSVQKAIQIQQQKNLQTRITLTEKQYSKARENNILLLKKLGEAEENLEFMRLQLQKLRRQKDQDAMQYRDSLQKMKAELLLHQNQKDLHLKQMSNSQVLSLKSVIDSREKEIARLQLKINSLQLQLRSQESNLKSILVQNQHYQKEVQELRMRAQAIRITEDSTGGQLLELQQSRLAIQRLVALLKTTEQYRKFSNYAEECKEILFLNQTQRYIKKSNFDFDAEKRRISHYCKDQPIDQRLLWVPTACYKALLQIKLRHQTLNQVCIQQILFELNKIWLLKEQIKVMKIRQEASSEMNKLKRKNFERYDQVIARKQIQRLKRELQELRMTKRTSNQDLQLLKNIGQYEDQLRLKDREIKLLSDRIKLMEIQNNNYDKVLYLEGSLWVIDKILGEIQQSCEEFSVFQSKVRSNYEQLSSKQSLSQFMKNCFQMFNEVTNSLNDKLIMMKQSVLKKIGNNKLTFNQSIGQIKTYA